jgi:O-acetyl-ADP-ribose deacetylase (regulator of RNase III)
MQSGFTRGFDMQEMQGNLFDSDATAIGHGVNIDGLMGAGIAKQYARLFPQMYLNYRALCNARNLHAGEVYVHQTPNLTIYNIASQDRPGRNARLEWLEAGVDAALWHAADMGHSILALPRIGCGIGGLLWQDVRLILERLDGLYSTTLEIWTL